MSKDGVDKHSRPGPAAVELAAWLLYPNFGKCRERDAGRIQAVIDALEAYGSAQSFAEMFPDLLEDEKDDRLAVHLRLHSGMVRGSAYPQQVMRRIEGVLRPFEKELAALIGIGPWRAFEIAATIGRQIEDNVNGMREAFRAIRSKGEVLANKGVALTEDEKRQLTVLGEELRQIVGGMEGDWVSTWTQIKTRLPDVKRTEWDAMRGSIGFTPESRAKTAKLVDVQDRPLFFLDDSRALLVHCVGVFDAVFSHFDDLARCHPTLSSQYGQRVADWMEREIECQFQRLFPSSAILRSACFSDPDNPGGETEADVVIVWGPFLVVAEAKGRRVAREAMRGSRTKLKQTIKKNIQDAFIQARRVVSILDRDGRIRFKEKSTGRTVDVERDRLQRVMPVSVTLQHLSGIPTQLAVTEQLGLFKGKAYPWSVSVDDLDVVTRFIGSPDVFLHYIERRIAQQTSNVAFNGDELDIFGHYLDNRLHPSVYEENEQLANHDGPRNIMFHGGEDRFEKIYFAEWEGEPLINHEVGLKLPEQVRGVFDELRSREDDGARWIAFALLGLNDAALDRLNGALRDVRKIPIEGRRIQRITAREGDIVLNVMAHRGTDEHEFHKNTLMRARMEHYRVKPKATITLGIDQLDESRAFSTATWVEGPWEKEDVLEKLLAEEREKPRTVQLFRSAKKPGRNDLCPCGSGKKFKRCCLDLMRYQSARKT